VELLPLAFTAGWASGINAFATALVLGLLGRFGHLPGVPTGLERADVLIILAVLTLVEMVADKIPYVDTMWDTLATIIRPVAGVLVGGMIGAAQGGGATIAFAVIGGVVALLSHLVKAGLRLAINTTPDRVTNVGASIMGDGAAIGLIVLGVLNPMLSAAVAAIVLIITIVAVIKVRGRIRRGYQAFRAWLAERRAPQPA